MTPPIARETVPAAAPIVLRPGDFRFGAAPLRLATLLGSCVTVTFWHPQRHLGAMCHIVTPGRARSGAEPFDARFADEAFALFDEAAARAGCGPGEFRAKLFGGGDMFPGAPVASGLGGRNIAVARELLRVRGIPLLAEHVGGTGRRKLVFDLATGDVWLYYAGQEAQ